MELIDIVIILLVLWGAHRGWKNGLFREFTSTVGFFIGLYVAYHCYEQFGDYLAPQICNTSIAKLIGKILAFVVIWIIVPILLGGLAIILTKTLNLISLGSINHLAGLCLGVAKYIVLLSFVVGAMNILGILSQEKRDASLLYKYIEPISHSVLKQGSWISSSSNTENSKIEQDTLWIPIHQEKK